MLRRYALFALVLEERLGKSSEEKEYKQSRADLCDELRVVDRSRIEGHHQLVRTSRDVGCSQGVVGTYQWQFVLAVQ